jgi:hypothetical protein
MAIFTLVRTWQKLVCAGEIVSGCLVSMFDANLAMTVWLQKFADATASARQTAAASVSGSETDK